VTIAHRKAIDLFRKAQRGAVPLADVPVPATELDIATELTIDGSDLDVTHLVKQLPERQRFAVIYHYLGGLPYAEVAAVIGGSPEAARRAAADGIAKLRRTRAITAHRHETKGTM
jgi:DNA-directed RNA polymerase specialized sigma24 family protein